MSGLTELIDIVDGVLMGYSEGPWPQGLDELIALLTMEEGQEGRVLSMNPKYTITPEIMAWAKAPKDEPPYKPLGLPPTTQVYGLTSQMCVHPVPLRETVVRENRENQVPKMEMIDGVAVLRQALPDAITALLLILVRGGTKALSVNSRHELTPEIMAWAKESRPEREVGIYILRNPERSRIQPEKAKVTR